MARLDRKFEKRFLRRRNAIERQGIRLFRSAIKQQYDYFLNATKLVDIERWITTAEQIPEQPIRLAMEKYYRKMNTLALMQRKHLLSQKDEEDDFWLSDFERFLLNYVRNEAGEKIAIMTETTKKRVVALVREVLDDANARGLGVPEIQRNLIKTIGKDLTGNARARARAIAQTEIVGGSNKAAMYAADSTGLEFRKFWSTSGLPNIRPTHLAAESYSNEVNGVRRDQAFPNGLMFPGDPNGEASEVINCRCALLLVAQ